MLDMYIREVTSSRKNGPDAVYLQLVEGYRDGKTGKVKTQILHFFGRKDKLELGQVRRLVNQLAGYLRPEDRPELLSGLEITHSLGLRRSLPVGCALARAGARPVLP